MSTGHPEALHAGGSEVAWRQTGEEVVILDLVRSTYFSLNAAGARLWMRLIEGSSHAELVTVLLAAGSSPDRSAEEVDRFLALLEAEGLLHRSAAPNSDQSDASHPAGIGRR